MALLAAMAPALAQENGAVAPPDSSPPFELLDVVTSRFGRTIAAIKSDFPDDYVELIAALSGISWQGIRDERVALLMAFEVMKSHRRAYAERVVHAPSVSHAVMLGLLADFYDEVLRREGPAVCGRFASDGSAVLFELGLSEKYAEQLDLQSAAFYDAVERAIEAPENPAAVRPEDWTFLLGNIVAAGAPRSFVDTIARGDPNDPDLCRALATMFRASGLLDTPEGARTRADLAKNLSGYQVTPILTAPVVRSRSGAVISKTERGLPAAAQTVANS
jgi:hypothetical protein